MQNTMSFADSNTASINSLLRQVLMISSSVVCTHCSSMLEYDTFQASVQTPEVLLLVLQGKLAGSIGRVSWQGQLAGSIGRVNRQGEFGRQRPSHIVSQHVSLLWGMQKATSQFKPFQLWQRFHHDVPPHVVQYGQLITRCSIVTICINIIAWHAA